MKNLFKCWVKTCDKKKEVLDGHEVLENARNKKYLTEEEIKALVVLEKSLHKELLNVFNFKDFVNILWGKYVEHFTDKRYAQTSHDTIYFEEIRVANKYRVSCTINSEFIETHTKGYRGRKDYVLFWQKVFLFVGDWVRICFYDKKNIDNSLTYSINSSDVWEYNRCRVIGDLKKNRYINGGKTLYYISLECRENLENIKKLENIIQLLKIYGKEILDKLKEVENEC